MSSSARQGHQPSAVDTAAAADPSKEALIRAYFRRVAVDDLPREPETITAMIAAHCEVGAVRRSDEVCVAIHTPQTGHDGWGGSSTVVDIVHRDMPYLVETVVAELAAAGLTAERVLHPILAVRRDEDGRLLEVVGDVSAVAERADVIAESWMRVLVDRLSDAARVDEVTAALRRALDQVSIVVIDTPAMAAAARGLSTVDGAGELLEWAGAGHMRFLGYRREDPSTGGTVEGSSLGLLRSTAAETIDEMLTTDAAATDTLQVGQLVLPVGIVREQPTLTLTIRQRDADGTDHRHRFLASLTPRGRAVDIATIPVLRETVTHVLDSLGAARDSFAGQRAITAVAQYPRAELFWADRDQVAAVVASELQMTSRRRLQVFLQPDPEGRFISVLVYLPRDRHTTSHRLAMQQLLLDRLGGSAIRYTARVSESPMAVVHFTVTTDWTDRPEVDVAALTNDLRETIQTWEDRLVAAVVGGHGGLDTADALAKYSDAFDEAYKEDYTAADAVADLAVLERLRGAEDLQLSVVRPPAEFPGDSRIKLYVTGTQITLSQAMPVLQSMGIDVIDERPYQVRRPDGSYAHIYDFGINVAEALRSAGEGLVAAKQRFSAALIASWHGHAETDGFNALVLTAGLDWRETAMIRAYARYWQQIGSSYTQGYLEQVLCGHPVIARHLVELFHTRFDPAFRGDRDARSQELHGAISTELDQTTSLDVDRILRMYLSLIEATDRTNFYRSDSAGTPVETLAFKIVPARVPRIPAPVPAHEIWVYSPRVEGVHLRFGPVARGGLRWSDRPEDFRTEVLGLVKAQEVKNAIIVPVGAKGGFVVKQAPEATGDAVADRDALQAEGVACYTSFVSAMLDITDNRDADGAIVPPADVVRHDDDDSYLVVAADKGTARFSDLANSISAEYGFWLGDAFASGGSAGYDHKEMGITARGAWESVKHHFRELGVDTQAEDFTCVGIGDMSGDVFGNGMLRSRHIRLVGAFDHRHIFVDPNPDAATSFQERQRLFDLPRSSWADYNTELISAGGGVWPRTAKSVPISPQMRAALGLGEAVTELAPADLIRAVLMAPVDLLWNGGIGTYIKASMETHASVGNKANDVVRVDGNQVRAKVIGEGGNLGVTQLGRIEYARGGGKINTDAIDNSAGVGSSDLEVNIKIALQPLITAGSLDKTDRNDLLVEMTDEVADLVLTANKAQNRLLGEARLDAPKLIEVHSRQIDQLVATGELDRELEFLPDHDEIAARRNAGVGLYSPELSVLIAYTKSHLASDVLVSDLPDEPAFRALLPTYFPTAMRERFADAIAGHSLAREIITTMVVNQMVNEAGMHFAFRLGEEVGASATDSIRAFTIATEVFDLDSLNGAINAADHTVPAQTQDRLLLLARRLLNRAARWLLTNRPQPLDVTAEITRYRDPIRGLLPQVPDLLVGVERENVARDIVRLQEQGATAELASTVAHSLYQFAALDITDVAESSGRDVTEIAGLYFTLSAHLGFDDRLTQVSQLERGDRWHALARQAVRDDMYRSLWQITADVVSTTDTADPVSARIEQWEQQNASRLARARSTLQQIDDAGIADLAALSVAAREIRSIIR